MKLSEMTSAQLDACLVKYIKYVAAIEREKNRRLSLSVKEKKDSDGSRVTSPQITSSKITSSGLVVSDEDLKAAEAAPITKEDVESVTRILKMSAHDLALSLPSRSQASSPEGLTEEMVEKEIQKTALKLSIKKIFLKAFELDKKAKRLDESVLKSYMDLMDLLRQGEDKTNPRFPRDSGVKLSPGLEEVLNDLGK